MCKRGGERERDREFVCLAFVSVLLFICTSVCVRLAILLSLFNLSLSLTLAPMSLSIVSIFLLSLTTYPSIYFERPTAIFSISHIFRPTSASHSPHFPVLFHISRSQRPLLFISPPIMSFYHISALLDLLLQPGYSPPLLPPSYLPHTPFPCILVSVGLRCLSPSLAPRSISVRLPYVSTTLPWYLISLCSH